MAAPQDECQDLPRLREGADQQGERPLTTAARAVPMATHIWCRVMRPETTARWGPDPLPVVGTGDRIRQQSLARLERICSRMAVSRRAP